MKKVIVHIDNSPMVTGAFKALLSFCRRTPEYRHVWVLPQGSGAISEVSKDFTTYELPFVEIRRSAAALLFYLPSLALNARRLRSILKCESADVVHINDLYNLVAYGARLRLGTPVIVHARMLERSFPKHIYRTWVALHRRLADAIVVASVAVARDWGGTDGIHIIYDAEAPTETHPPYRFQPPLSGAPFRFLYLANYIPGKGQETAVMAAAQVKAETRLPFTINFVGDWSLQKSEGFVRNLRRLAERLNLESAVTFNGPSSDVEGTMKDHHAVLHFSQAESFGMVCFEALSYGLPLISTRCGGPEELVTHGENGLLVDLDDTAAAAEAMVKFVTNPSMAAALSARRRAPIVDGLRGDQLGLERVVEAVLATR